MMILFLIQTVIMILEVLRLYYHLVPRITIEKNGLGLELEGMQRGVRKGLEEILLVVRVAGMHAA